MVVDWIFNLSVIFTILLAALGILYVLTIVKQDRALHEAPIFKEDRAEASFLFDGEDLVDATPSARRILALGKAAGTDWARLCGYIGPRFPDFSERIADLVSDGHFLLTSETGGNGLILRGEWRGGLTRLTLLDPDQDQAGLTDDPVTARIVKEELAMLRSTISQAPVMIWRETPEGDITWANATYLMHAAARLEAGTGLSWPLPRLFDRTASAQGASGQRQSLSETAGHKPQWFELIGFAEGETRLMYALPADSAVTAEASLREFMQTLTKTFAHLPIGLAIVDKNRQLALFNPALLDLSGLQPDFLSMRPTLFAFLDAMRDCSMIPEPKDYRGWRKQMTDLEKAAASGLFEETWSLPSGQTYKVIGRPHPNGALALMFEDITSETSRTRRYRANLELGQAVIDSINDAVAVFSQAGHLVMSNAAYVTLWGHDPGAVLGAEIGFASLCERWRAQSAPTPFWVEAETFVSTLGERLVFDGDVRLNDGRLITCTFKPLQGGATLACFRDDTVRANQTPRIATDLLLKTA